MLLPNKKQSSSSLNGILLTTMKDLHKIYVLLIRIKISLFRHNAKKLKQLLSSSWYKVYVISKCGKLMIIGVEKSVFLSCRVSTAKRNLDAHIDMLTMMYINQNYFSDCIWSH